MRSRRATLRLLVGLIVVALALWLCLVLTVVAAWAYGYREPVGVARLRNWSLATHEGGSEWALVAGNGRFALYGSWLDDRYAGAHAILRLMQRSFDVTRWEIRRPPTLAGPVRLPSVHRAIDAPEPWTRRLGFGRYRERTPNRLDQFGLMAPGWLVAGVVGVPWLLLTRAWARSRRSRRRRAAGQCVRCGYDLRASTERCPECGQSRMA